jgi:hypothetical protein
LKEVERSLWGHQRRFKPKPRTSTYSAIPDISLRRTARRPNRLTRDDGGELRQTAGLLHGPPPIRREVRLRSHISRPSAPCPLGPQFPGSIAVWLHPRLRTHDCDAANHALASTDSCTAIRRCVIRWCRSSERGAREGRFSRLKSDFANKPFRTPIKTRSAF